MGVGGAPLVGAEVSEVDTPFRGTTTPSLGANGATVVAVPRKLPVQQQDQST
jgi:hypothetical protein